jgi:hypothetical protein
MEESKKISEKNLLKSLPWMAYKSVTIPARIIWLILKGDFPDFEKAKPPIEWKK